MSKNLNTEVYNKIIPQVSNNLCVLLKIVLFLELILVPYEVKIPKLELIKGVFHVTKEILTKLEALSDCDKEGVNIWDIDSRQGTPQDTTSPIWGDVSLKQNK